ncbi:hypothetical protein BDV19DRAFT_388483 [Aspergillus venezuelensis]
MDNCSDPSTTSEQTLRMDTSDATLPSTLQIAPQQNRSPSLNTTSHKSCDPAAIPIMTTVHSKNLSFRKVLTYNPDHYEDLYDFHVDILDQVTPGIKGSAWTRVPSYDYKRVDRLFVVWTRFGSREFPVDTELNDGNFKTVMGLVLRRGMVDMAGFKPNSGNDNEFHFTPNLEVALLHANYADSSACKTNDNILVFDSGGHATEAAIYKNSGKDPLTVERLTPVSTSLSGSASVIENFMAIANAKITANGILVNGDKPGASDCRDRPII